MYVPVAHLRFAYYSEGALKLPETLGHMRVCAIAVNMYFAAWFVLSAGVSIAHNGCSGSQEPRFAPVNAPPSFYQFREEYSSKRGSNT
ncbi:hypothetical protein K440DRAFT_106521 [Wilcoxina mikolae CBS 423.85]|nr:hypothetical protein K440DRAFT_106521 [Wilcoxina mikolae CBS 423.85]